MAFKKIRVLIVDDSIFFLTALKKLFTEDEHLEVVGSATNAYDAEKMIKELSPDVVTLDVEMPGMRGTDLLNKILPTHPLPIILVSSINMGVFEALDAGAVDFVKKPDNTDNVSFHSFCNELKTKVKIASTARIRKKSLVNLSAQAPISLNTNKFKRNIVAIGASTGGTEATLAILKQLPAKFPGVLIVQHMPPGFTKMYADRLNKICTISVSEAKHGDRVEQGHALIAPGDKHMTLERDAKGYYVRCFNAEKVSGHCPSVDVLFDSVAKRAGSDSIGVILTGMGRDGANGLLNMKNSGAYTIGQDRASCVVYGMPREAFIMGAVTKQESCENIASVLIRNL